MSGRTPNPVAEVVAREKGQHQQGPDPHGRHPSGCRGTVPMNEYSVFWFETTSSAEPIHLCASITTKVIRVRLNAFKHRSSIQIRNVNLDEVQVQLTVKANVGDPTSFVEMRG